MKTKIVLWPRANAKGLYPLKLRISDGDKNVYKPTGVCIEKKQWNAKSHTLKAVKPDSESQDYKDYLNLKNLLSSMIHKYDEKIASLAKEGRTVTVDQLIKLVENPVRDNTVFSYFQQTIDRYKLANNLGMARIHRMTLASLKSFESDMKFHDIDLHFIKRYEDYLRGKGLKNTTISIYMRTLRMIYNKAIGEGYAKQENYPFGKKSDNRTFTISDLDKPTPKRAITKDQIEAIKNLEDLTPEQEAAREIFLFSYYTAGINFNDICKLKWENVKGNHIEYIRTKTGAKMNTILVPFASNVIQKLKFRTGIDPDNYVFDILNIHIHQSPQQIENRIHKVLGQTNKRLKEIAVKAKIKDNVSTYTARHSFITHSANSGLVSPFDLMTIVGHADIKTTMIYFKDAGQQARDNTMLKIMGL